MPVTVARVRATLIYAADVVTITGPSAAGPAVLVAVPVRPCLAVPPFLDMAGYRL